jgi:nucleoside-diphosphate-sugar epimerase
MKVLVTGATGGLGKLVIEQLLELGHEVVATSRNIEKARKTSFFNKVMYLPYDITEVSSSDNLYVYFGEPDLLIHLAWDKLDDYKNEGHLQSILENHKKFALNLISTGLKNFNGIGTCYEYGLREGQLFEDYQASPVLPYPKAKNALKEYIEKLTTQYSFTFKWIRVFYVFGEIEGRKNLYTHLMSAIKNQEISFNMSGGEQIRDFLSPLEVAEKITLISIQNEVKGVINCCSGDPVKLKDFIVNFLIKNGYKIQLNFGYYDYVDYEPMETWGSVTKFNSISKTDK